ncbi:D-alanyl-D-alanine carboxypeptidase family protein [Thalassiella azotivora]
MTRREYRAYLASLEAQEAPDEQPPSAGDGQGAATDAWEQGVPGSSVSDSSAGYRYEPLVYAFDRPPSGADADTSWSDAGGDAHGGWTEPGAWSDEASGTAWSSSGSSDWSSTSDWSRSTDWAGSEWSGDDRSGSEWSGSEWSGDDRSGSDWSTTGEPDATAAAEPGWADGVQGTWVPDAPPAADGWETTDATSSAVRFDTLPAEAAGFDVEDDVYAQAYRDASYDQPSYQQGSYEPDPYAGSPYEGLAGTSGSAWADDAWVDAGVADDERWAAGPLDGGSTGDSVGEDLLDEDLLDEELLDEELLGEDPADDDPADDGAGPGGFVADDPEGWSSGTDWDAVDWTAPAGTELDEAAGLSRREVRAHQAQAEAARIAELRRARRARAAAWTGQLPRVGIVGALGLATVVAPMTGDQPRGGGETSQTVAQRVSEVSEPVQDAASLSAEALLAASDFRVVPELPAGGEALRVGTGAALSLDQLTASRQEAERASRDLGRPILPGCDGVVRETGAANGRLNLDDLCELWKPGHHLRADAAVAFAELNAAYTEAFGEPIMITDSYRSYAAQVSVRNRKPGLAARPGTSEHGWGMAVDLGGGIQNGGSRYRWMRENAPRFGWDNPAWARSGGSGPYEPWHWEYTPSNG